MTCSTRSASAVSSSVARNAATSVCGSRSMKPTVSLSSSGAAVGQHHLADQRIQRDEQRVRGLGRGLGQAIEERGLAGVRVADERDGGHRRSCAGDRATGPAGAGPSSISCSRPWIRIRIFRRSTSSLVSPGPSVPMPPPSRDISVPMPTSRGSRYFSCASSTWSLPSRVRARLAKMSRMSCVRSTTLRSQTLAELAQLRRRQLVVEDDDVDVGLVGRLRQQLHLAAAEKRRRVGLRPFLQHAQDDARAGRLGQAFQLFDRTFGVEASGRARHQSHERGALCAPGTRCSACVRRFYQDGRRDPRPRQAFGWRPGQEAEVPEAAVGG